MKEVSSRSQSLECATWMDINLPKWIFTTQSQSVVLLPSSSTACECGRNILQIFPSQNSPQGFRVFWVSKRGKSFSNDLLVLLGAKLIDRGEKTRATITAQKSRRVQMIHYRDVSQTQKIVFYVALLRN